MVAIYKCFIHILTVYVGRDLYKADGHKRFLIMMCRLFGTFTMRFDKTLTSNQVEDPDWTLKKTLWFGL